MESPIGTTPFPLLGFLTVPFYPEFAQAGPRKSKGDKTNAKPNERSERKCPNGFAQSAQTAGALEYILTADYVTGQVISPNGGFVLS